MFTEKKSNSPQVLERNTIAKNTSITGDIKSEGDFRIDGSVEGTINTNGRVVIGVEGSIKGTVECENADIEGIFSGKLMVSELLSLKKTAKISGEVTINQLLVEPGALFNATCEMDYSGIKELNRNGSKKRKRKEETA
jgi:cytoskeletal protein CcmA (bactofilin family)|tara:strand:+ start:1373 stop:1786 length:414 start_codon:yes stop_codon:yes gene_type:complete